MDRLLAFGRFAGQYDDDRPVYPTEALDWLLERSAHQVVDLGAGTGKLTRQLVDRGVSAIAVEPDSAMLARLERDLPQVRALQGGAERIPVEDHTADAVLVAQAWHWFDAQAALREIARVLKPTGRLGLLWNAPAPTSRWQTEMLAAGPTVSPVRDGWWPAGLPREGTEHLIVRWHQLMTADEIWREHLTHLPFRNLPPDELRRLLSHTQRVARAEAERLRADRVVYERLTWCARRTPASPSR